MTDYLSHMLDWNDPDTITVFDEVPLWSAMFGLMLLARVPLRPQMRVIDLGCGTGFPLVELAERLGATCQVYGLDGWFSAFQRAALKLRVRHVTNVQLIGGDGAIIPLAPGSIDLVVSNLGINNFPDPPRVAAECARILRPGGQLILTTNLRGHMAEFYTVFAQTLQAHGNPALLTALEAHIAHRATIPACRELLTGAGLQVTHVQEQTSTMRYLDGSAFLRHSFIRQAFLESWREILPPEEEAVLFARLEENLNNWASRTGELTLTIPMACVTAEKPR